MLLHQESNIKNEKGIANSNSKFHRVISGIFRLPPVGIPQSTSETDGGYYFLTYETEFVLFLAVLENSVLPETAHTQR